MTRLLALLVVLTLAGAAAAQPRPPAANAEIAPTSTLDGDWRGTSDGGSCNAPLDYVLTIENGFVDGSAWDTTAHGPVPNLRRAPPPAPTPGLWQIHGVAKNTSAFSLISASRVPRANHPGSQSGTWATDESGNKAAS